MRPPRTQTPAKIDAIFSRFDHRDAPGCMLGVSRAGKIVYEKGYGMADLEQDVPITSASIFHVASISKQFTAVAILLLEQQGKLSVDDEVRKYVPELPDQKLVVAALCNASNSDPGGLTRQVADLYLGSALAPNVAQARQAGGISLPPARLASLAGAYRRSTGDILRIELRDGKLAVREARTELLPLTSTRFALRSVDGEATFDIPPMA